MSEITLSVGESLTSTTTGGSQGFTAVRPVAISSPPAWITISTLTPGSRRSPRTGRLPLGAAIAQREAADEQFRQRMSRARVRLAAEMQDDNQNCVARMRLSRGLSQQRLAELSGITQPHLAKIESGRLSIQFATAVRLADALGVSVDDLKPLVQAGPGLTAQGASI